MIMAGPFLAEENSRTTEWIEMIVFTFEFIRVVIVRFLVCDGWILPGSVIHYSLGAYCGVCLR